MAQRPCCLLLEVLVRRFSPNISEPSTGEPKSSRSGQLGTNRPAGSRLDGALPPHWLLLGESSGRWPRGRKLPRPRPLQARLVGSTDSGTRGLTLRVGFRVVAKVHLLGDASTFAVVPTRPPPNRPWNGLEGKMRSCSDQVEAMDYVIAASPAFNSQGTCHLTQVLCCSTYWHRVERVNASNALYLRLRYTITTTRYFYRRAYLYRVGDLAPRGAHPGIRVAESCRITELVELQIYSESPQELLGT